MPEGGYEPIEEERADAPGEDTDGQEDAGQAGDPAIVFGSETGAGDDAVEVEMEGEIRMRYGTFHNATLAYTAHV